MGCGGSSLPPKDCRENQGGDDTAGYGGCSSWSPGSYVAYNSQSGVYEVEEDLVREVSNDPYLLIACDSAYYVPVSGGYYALGFIDSTDLAHHLGFQNGDVILSVNAIDLQWPQDYLDALSAVDEETEFEISVKRNGNTISLFYEFVP
jgi:hypothetical protein